MTSAWFIGTAGNFYFGGNRLEGVQWQFKFAALLGLSQQSHAHAAIKVAHHLVFGGRQIDSFEPVAAPGFGQPRQFVPEVTTILLGPDPSEYVSHLQDCRLFEPGSITAEDVERTNQYRAEAERKALESSVTDMDSYLSSLDMEGTISEFTAVDVPRLSQLINKSNQFNLTTRRRSEAEVLAVMNNPALVGYSMHLKDRFGDHGLISIVIGQVVDGTLKIDTWLMSCRVLKRQVEEEVLNELARLAKARGCHRLEGVYLPTAKNDMVRDFYSRMGMTLLAESDTRREFELRLDNFQPIPTKIKITRRAYEPS